VEIGESLMGSIHYKFNPSKMSAQALENTFVQRESLAERIVTLLNSAADTGSTHHILLVGPRGVGKSHLVSVVHNRLISSGELREKMVIASLREDEWGITTLLDLQLRVLEALGIDTTSFAGPDLDAAERRAIEEIDRARNGRLLTVIVENLDILLESIGDHGQRQWRSLMQNRPFWCIVATSSSLSAHLVKRSAPFYGFFEIHILEGLSVDEAIDLLARLARSDGREDLAEEVAGPVGRARIRAVQHLANGNHRIFAVFYDFLAESDTGNFIAALTKTIDSLTPYYQSRMRELSPQQRKIVEFLCLSRQPARVKSIASRCFVTQQTAASQLKILLENRFLRRTQIGRESYYELNEPLLRVCIEAKERGPAPMRLLVEFLRYWFSRAELEDKAHICTAREVDETYYNAALQEYEKGEGHDHLSPEVGKLCRRLTLVTQKGSRSEIHSVAGELAQVSLIAEDWVHYTKALSYVKKTYTAELALLEKKREEKPNDVGILRAVARPYSMSGKREEGLAASNRAIELAPTDALLRLDRGEMYRRAKNEEAALKEFKIAVKLRPKWEPPKLELAGSFINLRRPKDALALLETMPPTPGEWQLLMAVALAELGQLAKALPLVNQFLEGAPERVPGLTLKGRILCELGDLEQAENVLERARKIDARFGPLRYWYCRLLFGRFAYQAALELFGQDVVAHQLYHELSRLVSGRSQESFDAWIARLLNPDLFAEVENALAGAITQFVSFVADRVQFWPAAAIVEWQSRLREVFGDNPKFQRALTILDVLGRYKASGDGRILLELPLEERRLIRDKVRDRVEAESVDEEAVASQ
jgi:tetratricopeptide (TPR) repeat protein